MTLQEINNLNGEAAEKLCDQLGLDLSGYDSDLRSRLRDYYLDGKIRLGVGRSITLDMAPQYTPDGLIIHKQEGVGLVVSAAEHNFKLSEWQAEKARLERRMDAALDRICGAWGYTRERASAWLDNPNSD